MPALQSTSGICKSGIAPKFDPRAFCDDQKPQSPVFGAFSNLICEHAGSPGQAHHLALDGREWYCEVLPIDTQLETVMAVAPVQPVAIKIDENTKARIRRLADACQRTPHWLMREAITQYVDREEKREAFRQDALQAWETFRATGQHVAADQADAWLAQLEQGNDLDPPACLS